MRMEDWKRLGIVRIDPSYLNSILPSLRLHQRKYHLIVVLGGKDLFLRLRMDHQALRTSSFLKNHYLLYLPQ